jgi:radical SAM superfamily enzyme YgiQ (UPF0313 family)
LPVLVMAEIILINPRFDPTYWGLDYALPFFRKAALLPPLNLSLLAGLTPPEHSVSILDENVEEIDYERCRRADIVGLTGMVVQRQRMSEIIIELKRRGIFTVLGGPCVTVSPEDLGPLVDVVFIGEAEETWPRFLAEWSEGRQQSRYEQADKTDMATVPSPRFDLLKMDKYLYGSLQVSRGCPFTCEFCDIIVVFGRRPRVKTVAQVIAEMEGLVAAGIHDAFIVDDNLIGNKKAIKTILREMIAWQEARGYRLSFITEASIDLAEDEELMQLMVKANIDTVFVGIESPNEDALRETKKIQNLTDRSGTALEKVHRIQEAGLMVTCGMIVGFDCDDESVFEAQRQFVHEARIGLAMVNILCAIPQTPLFKRLSAAGRLVDGDALNRHSTFAVSNVVPLKMTQQTLNDGYLELMRSLYTVDAFFSRLDAVCFGTRWLPAAGRTQYLRRHRLRWLKLRARAGVEAVYLFVQLMRRVPDATLRRHYRARLWNVLKNRPNIRLLRFYCLACAMHFHYDRLIGQMEADHVVTQPAAGPDGGELVVGVPTSPVGQAVHVAAE